MTQGRPYACVFLMSILYLAVPNDARACTCIAAAGETAWPTFEEAAARSDAVLIGRVLKQVRLKQPVFHEGLDVAYVDVRVLDPIKGTLGEAHAIRVWDSGFGTTCSVDLRDLKPGTLVALALERNKPAYREYQDLLKLKIEPDAYLLVACGDYRKVLTSEAEATELAARIRESLRQER